MNRYFYTIENEDTTIHSQKVIHIMGNLYYNDAMNLYNLDECSFLYLNIMTAQNLIKNKKFDEYYSEHVKYVLNMSEEDLEDFKYFDENSKYLDILDITENTECGYYWFNLE